DVLLHLGNWYDSVNLRDKSKAAYKKALQLKPDNPLAKKIVAIDAIEEGDLSRARQLLRFMETPAPGKGHDPVVLLMLADAYQQRQEHDSALEVLQTALTIEPNLRNDKEFRKTVRKSEKFNLTRQPLLPPRSIFKSREFYLAAGLATVIAVFLGVNYYISTHRTLNIVNSLGRVVRITVQGHDELRVPSGGRVELTVREGSHQAVLVSEDGRKKEVQFTIESGFWGRYFDDPVYILNAFGATPILWEKWFYAPRNSGTPPNEGRLRVHLGRDFVSFDDIDHPFEELPGEIEMSESEQETSRTRVSVIKMPPPVIVESLTTQEIVSKKDLMQYAETHLRANPQDKPLLLAYCGLIYINQETPRCRKFLAEGLDKKPIRIDWHRYYEQMCDTTDQSEKLKQRYDRMLGEAPNNSALLYLAGRLPPRCSEAMKYMTRSIAADPKNPYPYMARAYYLMSRGQFDRAKLAALTAHQLDPENGEITSSLLGAHFAMKEYSEFMKEIDRLSIAEPADFNLHCQRLVALTASGDIEA
ncbi:MAG: tetratricopeptide repeat protein, partial [Phycisphaerae bacterium]|nr:tetratricopeptide repeat protein [Phycisphaerae bacterium]